MYNFTELQNRLKKLSKENTRKKMKKRRRDLKIKLSNLRRMQ